MNLWQPLERIGFSPYIGVAPRPRVSDDYESNVPGMYVVGDLVDAPVIKMALIQGREVGEHVARQLGSSNDDTDADVIIVGAGPAGLAAAEAVAASGLRVVLFDKVRPANTIHAFAKGKPIFAEPEDLDNPTSLWIGDATKEALADRWDAWVRDSDLPVHAPEEVTEVRRVGERFEVQTKVGAGGPSRGLRRLEGVGPAVEGASLTYTARRIIVAVGKRGAVRRLGIEGEHLDKVQHHLADPAAFAGRRVLVVGGGDSAVEAAIATAEAGAEVTLSYRRAELSRPKSGNLRRFEELVEAGRVRFEGGTVPSCIREHEVELSRGNEVVVVDNDAVLVFVGAGLPEDLLRRLGVQLEGQFRWLKALWVAAFVAFVYAFYVLKTKQGFWPFGDGDVLGMVPGLLEVDLGFRTVDPGFWGTVTYTLVVVIFGAIALRRYRTDGWQVRRYLSLIGFQSLFLFGIPELFAPALYYAASKMPGLSGGFVELFLSRWWHVYAVTVPWPLSIWSLVESPAWVGGWTAEHIWVAVLWTAAGLVTSFVVVPLFVWRFNESFCSWMCGCGGMAETLGDRFRVLAPRGWLAKNAEWAGVVVLLLAIPTTLLIVNDAWQFLQSPWLGSAKDFAQGWYGLMVDFMLASFVGVAAYPILGNRVWCRFFCPLRAYMELISRFVGRLGIVADSRCISCGECSRVCQMGIDVQTMAETQVRLDNTNSACIQCGMCVSACPMDVLTLEGGGRRAQATGE